MPRRYPLGRQQQPADDQPLPADVDHNNVKFHHKHKYYNYYEYYHDHAVNDCHDGTDHYHEYHRTQYDHHDRAIYYLFHPAVYGDK